MGHGKFRYEPEGRLCPHCNSFERTRHFWLYLEQEKILDSKPTFLHFAPEQGLEKRLRAILGDFYKTTDLEMPGVDLRENITSMAIPVNSFDFIYCSNVLEHVEDDAAAMEELHRILVPGGTAVIQVPIRGESTYEDPSITDPAERVVQFGQSDHVRYYGRDIIKRLSCAGFTVEDIYMLDFLKLSQDNIVRMNLGKRELIHICRKPSSGSQG